MEKGNMKPLVAVIGPTATGKSGLAIHLAQMFNGEVVSADSRQVYRHMDIGTAKVGPEERFMVPHHLIDIKNPGEDFSLAQYRETALDVIADIQNRGKLPVLAGGTGQYVWAILEGWEIPRVGPDTGLREELENIAETEGIEGLYRELKEKDPEAAAGIDPRNVRRVIRALEVVRQTGKPFSQQRTRNGPPFDVLILGLTAERKELYRRTDLRVDRMIESGLEQEVKNLLEMGVQAEFPAVSSIGYKQMVRYLKSELSLEEAIARIKTETHRLVRRQYNWFSLTDERIHWLDIEEDYVMKASELVAEFTGR